MFIKDQMHSFLFVGVLFFCISGCKTNTVSETFDLTAPKDLISQPFFLKGQVSIKLPFSIGILDTDRILLKTKNNFVKYLKNTKLIDNLHTLLQSRLIETLENFGMSHYVGRPNNIFSPQYTLYTEIRSFNIDESRRKVNIELFLKLSREKDGVILASKVFNNEQSLFRITPENVSIYIPFMYLCGACVCVCACVRLCV